MKARSRANLFLPLTFFLLLGGVGSFAGGPAEVYDKTIRGVVWIVNFLPQGAGQIEASGFLFLIDKPRRLVVTDYHVTVDEEEMNVYFPAREGDGDLIDDRDYYQKNQDALAKIGYYAVGRTIAKDSSKDLAILSLTSVPETSTELELSHQDPNEKAGLNMMGNPGGRPLWCWSRGTADKVADFETTFKDNQSVSFRALYFFSDSFGGNSGGPVLDDDGKVVGVAESHRGPGGMRATAVHYSEVQDLLDSVKQVRVVSLENKTNGTLPYSLKWGNGEWNEYKLDAGECYMWWWSGVDATVRFDCSYAEGFQEKTYTLNYFTTYIGRGCDPDKERDAREYYFEANGQSIELYSN